MIRARRRFMTPMPFQNPSPEAIKALLKRVKTIAVVGLSPKPNRPSFTVARALQGHDGRDVKTARENRRVRGGAADIGDEGRELVLLELDGIGWRQVVRYQNDRAFLLLQGDLARMTE